MKDDPAIQRIREARHQVSERNLHDPRKVVGYYIELQEKYEKRLLPKKTIPSAESLAKDRHV